MKKYLTRRKLKLLFTVDEMMIRTSDMRGQSDFYYNGNRVLVPENMRKIPPQKLASTGYGRYGILLAWQISLVCRSGKNQSELRSLHQIDSEANDHLRYSSVIRR